MMDVFRCSVMRRHNTLSKSVATLGVFADCPVGKDNPLDVQAHPFACLNHLRTTLCRLCRMGTHSKSLHDVVFCWMTEERSLNRGFALSHRKEKVREL
jgi:hypothetical protein